MRNGESGAQDSIGIRKALIIAVSEYGNNLQSLDFCEKDGEEIYKVLKSIGYEIPDSHKLVGQVNYETMKERIYDFFTDINTKSEDVLLFYYSGHGVPDVNGDVFLASSEINHDAPFRKGFSFYDLTNTIERSNSTRIVTILDCCYSGAAKVSKGHEEDAARLGTVAIDDKSKKLQQQGEGKCLLAASMGYQEAYGLKEKGHSIFTYYLLDGFRGAKKAVDEDGNVTPDSLGKYVYREIINLPKEKRPKQKPIRKVEAGGDIILAQYPELTKKEPTQDPYESIQDATEFLKKGDYPSAIQYSDKALAINPNISVAYSIKGQALYNLKKYDEALVCYNKALELRPRYLEVLNYKAIVLNDLGKYEEAIESLNQSTDLNPNDAIIWNSKGLAFNKVRKYNEAIECFDKAIKLNPTYAEALKNEHAALSNLRQELHAKQEQEQEERIQGQTGRINVASKDTKIETISAPKTKETKIDTLDIASKESPSGLATSKDIPLSEESSQEKKKVENMKPKEGIQPLSSVFPSMKNATQSDAREINVDPTNLGINRNVTSPSQQIPERYNKPQQGTAFGSSSREDSGGYVPGKNLSALGGEEKRNENIHPVIREQSQQKNLKKFIPIIAGVVGIIIAIAIFGTTTTPPEVTNTPTPTIPPETTPSTAPETTPSTAPETTPSTPSDDNNFFTFGKTTPSTPSDDNNFFTFGKTTPSTAPETTPSTAPETTPSTAPETTPSTAPEAQNKYGDAMTTFEEEAGEPLPQTTTAPPQPTPEAPAETTTTAPAETSTTTPNETTTTTSRPETTQDEDGMTTFEEEAAGLLPQTTTTAPSQTTTTAPAETGTEEQGEQQYSFLKGWGSYGSGEGQFDMSAGGDVNVDSSDRVYVADGYNDRIQVFDKDGTFLTVMGSYGSGDGEFTNATDLAIDYSGNIYVTDTGNNRIQKFDSNGNFITSWGSYGSGSGQFDYPISVDTDYLDNVYVADSNNSRIQKFDSNGNFITSWGSYGSGSGQFDIPSGVSDDNSGHVYVADSNNSRIQKFDSNGNFITSWGSYGSSNGQFDDPSSVTVDDGGYVYVGDGNNNRIQKFDSNGNFITSWGSYGSGNGQFDYPILGSVDSLGHIYVADSFNNRIQIFAKSP